MRFLIRMAASAAAIFGVAYLSGGSLLEVDSFWPAAVVAAIVLALVNAIIKPIVKLLALPVTILTLGLFALVINAGMLYLVAAIVDGVHTTGFLQTVAASVIISIVSSVVGGLTEGKKE
ncbi:MAG: phage holin family protein [Actinobacteria bacterium]|nr:phage holin family protein [Actinomycetota bacterium]